MTIMGWPSGTIDQAPVPANILPPRIQGWPAGTQRAANDAERLLSTAVAWWDAAAYRNGDRFLRNRGVAGELLDLRLGSSVVANTNDPLWLGPGPDNRGYIYLTGVAANNLATTDNRSGAASTWQVSALVDYSEPLANAALLDRSSGVLALFVCQMSGTTAARRPRIQWMDGSNTARATTNTVSNPLPNGLFWFRFTLDASGANTVATWEYADPTTSEPSSWTSVATETFVGVTGLTVPNISAKVGSLAYADSLNLQGKVYRVVERIDGTTVLDIDCDAITSGSATSFTATTGQTVTINRSTSGRKSVAMPAQRLGGKPCFLFGTDDYMEVQDAWQHQALNFGQGDSFTMLIVNREWANPVSAAHLLAKLNDQTFLPGYSISHESTSSTVNYSTSDGTIEYPNGWYSVSTFGTTYVGAAVFSRAAKTATTYANGPYGSRSTPIGAAPNTLTFRIGRASGSSTFYATMEFRAAAVWRRPLTAAEIKTISDYYTTGG